jgi:hypothetical protein
LYERLAEIGGLLAQFEHLKISVELSEQTRTALTALVNGWAALRIPPGHKLDSLMNRRAGREFEVLKGVVAALPRITHSDDLLEKIWDKAWAMDARLDGEIHAFLLYPVLVQRWPERKGELIDRMRRALLSDQQEEVREAVAGLYSWIRDFPQNGRCST